MKTNNLLMDPSYISAIIIDDEADAINLLEMYMRHFKFIQVVGSETRSTKAFRLVKSTQPDLIFLDIDMPDLNGLQLAARIYTENIDTEIIFTTAHQQYAFDALEVKPLDFLTKPFSIEDLNQVIQKYKAKAEKRKRDNNLDRFIHSQSNSTKIKFPSNHGMLLLDPKEIVYLSVNVSNCSAYLFDGSVEIITQNLNQVIEILNSQAYIQTNRSTFVNINFLKRIDKKKHKCYLAINENIQEIHFSKYHLNEFEKLDQFRNISFA